ncbi:hypothetical protein A5821_001320 [Enterococcus sp. 7F3_DIV0205]|uniref:DUF2974 domain-containing protein n=1 Tax=Candidatus Enterococcus palustris TaxID=1834189 RepID=A0AAQ3WA03_9ENTE|nr:hypothetical protein A5821_001664 [Enterococcus sp. 7F3_DIV0205]
MSNVTVIYRGSSEPFKEDDWLLDWLDNDIPIGQQILTNEFTGPTPQLKSSARTLDEQMWLYANAYFDIYGHSLGSMNGQYALASSKYPERIRGAYLYQGPNIYSLLTKEQKLQADKLRDQVFNYVDFKDMIPIGYDLKGIGIIIPVNSKEDIGFVDRHMWGGYQYDSNGNLNVPEGKMIAIRTAQTKIFIKDQLNTLGKLAAKLKASGGGLSSSEEIFLDSQCVLAIANGVYQLVQQAIQDLSKEYDTQITEIEELWEDTLDIARNVGAHLNESERIDALSAGGCTKQTLVTQPIKDLKDKFSEIKSIGADYVSLVDQIKAGVQEQLAADQDLARQVGNL